MVIDSSALVAILKNEPEAEMFAKVINDAETCMMSVANVLEASLVMQSRHHDDGEFKLDVFLKDSAIEIVPFTQDQLDIARRAFRKYGKGRHPAGLNFGDCIAYALAKDMDEPLLFKGGDFSKTDIISAVIT
jgi:ribonuclease VapC